MSIFINRSIDFKNIKAIGFDMDHTLVRYREHHFEELSHRKTLESLVGQYGYPEETLNLQFDFTRVIQGLFIDRKHGHLLKVSRFGRVKKAYRGEHILNKSELQNTYHSYIIDIRDERFLSLDTNFSISQGGLYSQLIALKDRGVNLPDESQICDDVKEALDGVHRDGTLKAAVAKNIELYIDRDEKLVELLKPFKAAGKKLIVITNSDYAYTKMLLEYSFGPYLAKGEKWHQFFDVVITSSKKPCFFTMKRPFMEICLDQEKKKLVNYPIAQGVFEGGHAGKLQTDLDLRGDEIIYVGDHIYGDVVSLKKNFNWRTALVIGPLEQELDSIEKARPLQAEIDQLFIQRDEYLETNLEMKTIDDKIRSLNQRYQSHFNPYWGELMRAKFEESYFADQVERFACLYMPKVNDLLNCGTNTFFRPRKRKLPHE